MSALHAGALRRRLSLEAPQQTIDEAGDAVVTWVEVARLWGALAALSGRERIEGARAEQAISHRVTMRWREGVTAAMRLRLGLRIFDIRAVRDPDEGRRVLSLDCEETTP